MRISPAVVALTIMLLVAAVGCTKQVTGTAQSDPNKPPLTLSKDGFGIVAGFEDAPARIEIFTEPQCSHCADLQHDFGDQIAYYIGVGQLKVTYRPLTFLDQEANGYSARVSNAMFLAAHGAEASKATGTEFQRFVEQLWSNQEHGGSGPTDREIGDLAKKAGMPDGVVKTIADGKSVVNIKNMEDSNFEYLYEVDPVDTGTPTVYDPKTDEKLDIFDDNWLTKLIQS